MSATIPERIDPWRAVKSGAAFDGRLRLDALPRLAAVLRDDWTDAGTDAGTDGGTGEAAPELADRHADYRLTFGRDDAGRPAVAGQVRAKLPLRCQRCLGVLELSVDSAPRLALLRAEHEADALPDDLDPLTVGDGLLSLADLVEDELLLAIPTIPRHAPGACQAAPTAEPPPVVAAPSAADRVNPFAILADLREVRGGVRHD